MLSIVLALLILVLMVPNQVVNTAKQASDRDGDGFPDWEEDFVAEKYMPYFEYDEEEYNYNTGSQPIRQFEDVIYLYQITPAYCEAVEVASSFNVTILDHQPGTYMSTILMTVVAIYPYDYVPDLSTASGRENVFAHFGDTEVVRLCIHRTENTEGSVNYQVGFVQMIRHSHAHTYWYSDFEETQDGHVWIHVSEGKHAGFASYGECEHSNDLSIQQVAWDEDCDDGIKIMPYTGPEANVGEQNAFFDIPFSSTSFASWMQNRGYQMSGFNPSYRGYTDTYDEYVWIASSLTPRASRYCGTYPINDFDSSNKRTIVSVGGVSVYEQEWCAGGIASKWYVPSVPFSMR